MIRVLLLIPTLDQSGAEKQLTLLATHLPASEFQIQVVALTRGGPYAANLEQHGIPLTIIGKRWKLDPFAFRRLRQILDEWKPQILHTWLFAANAYGRILAGRNPRMKVLVSERCVDSWKSGWQLRLDRWLIPRTTRLIGNSQSVAEFYHGQGVPAEKTVVIPNGIEVGPAPARESPDRARIRSQILQVPLDAPVIGCVGRLARQKRVEDLIWAFELFRCIREDAYFVIAGEGPERDRLMQFARDVRVEHRIRFLGHTPNISEIWAGLDVFWLASDFEGLSNSLMEAMAAGLPVVASDIPPNRELVTHEQTGLLVPVGDRVQFAKCTERLFTDPELASRLGSAARERMREHFSIENMVDAYARLYREVLGC